ILLACGACGEDVHVHLLAPEETSAEVVTSSPAPTASPSAPAMFDGGASPEQPMEASARETPADNPNEPTETADAGPILITSDAAVELPLGASLLHHYDFSGTGTTLVDLVGEADGEIVGGAELDAMGGLTLDGVDDYANLPNGLISSLDEVTLAMWLTWHGNPCWQRLFDIGTSVDGEDVASYAATSIFVTPSSCGE